MPATISTSAFFGEVGDRCACWCIPTKSLFNPRVLGTWDIGEAHIQHRYIVPIGTKKPSWVHIIMDKQHPRQFLHSVNIFVFMRKQVDG